MPTPEETVRGYLDALAAREATGFDRFWAPDGVDVLHGDATLRGPEEIERYFAGVFAAFPDIEIRPLEVIAAGDRVVARLSVRGTLAGAPYQGVEANGARVDTTGTDVFTVRDGRIVRNDAVLDGLTIARQVGLLPAKDSVPEQRLTRLFNARTRATRRLMITEPERIADGVWLLRGDLKSGMNVFLIEQPGGRLVMYDGGTRPMTRGIAAAAARMGGIDRVVLGHAHVDHRGAVPGLGLPVWCHADEVADAEGDGGVHYQDLDDLPLRVRHLYKHVLFPLWDGGPVEVAGTLAEGDEVAGFEVVHTPGHAPGLIALHRRSDGLVLCSDLVYMADSITFKPYGEPHVPIHYWNLDTDQARQSVRKVAALDPKVVWTGHTHDPIDGDVRRRLEAAADRG